MAFIARFLVCLTLLCISQVSSSIEPKIDPTTQALIRDGSFKELQNKIRYDFQNEGLLVRAMTHSSFSFDNNGVLNIVGSSIIQVATSLHYILEDSNITKGNLSSKITEVSKACLDDARKLELPKLIRVGPKVDPESKTVACSCYHALFGAIAVDAKSLDVAEAKFWNLHGWSSPSKSSEAAFSTEELSTRTGLRNLENAFLVNEWNYINL